jgi:hypothetical protein
MYFIILTAAVTLHQNGVTHIETSKQAAEALRPLAGSLALFPLHCRFDRRGFCSLFRHSPVRRRMLLPNFQLA